MFYLFKVLIWIYLLQERLKPKYESEEFLSTLLKTFQHVSIYKPKYCMTFISYQARSALPEGVLVC